jgi:hypothetical protein
MKFRIATLLVTTFALYSCSTKQFVSSFSPVRPDQKADFLIVRNDTSMIIPVGIYPDQRDIERYVVRKRKAIHPIDSLIYTELTNRGLSVSIVNKGTGFTQGSNFVTYQDYWAWDFKKYMHVLKISFYDPLNGKKILQVSSQGNKMGMHDYPNPKKQVPVLIEKAMNVN